MSKKMIAIQSMMLLLLLTAFNNCGNGTYIDPKDSLDSASVGLSSLAPKLTANSYQTQTGSSVPLKITDGKPPFTFSISPATSGAINGADEFVAIKAGVVTVTLTDAAGRVATIAMNVVAPAVVPPPPLVTPVRPIGGGGNH